MSRFVKRAILLVSWVICCEIWILYSANLSYVATCTATGLAIMAPGVSRVCSVCELRCLNLSELSRMAKEYLGAETVGESSGEVCGGCGGKFLV